MIRYVHASTLDELANEVNGLLAQGWQPVGGVAVSTALWVQGMWMVNPPQPAAREESA